MSVVDFTVCVQIIPLAGGLEVSAVWVDALGSKSDGGGCLFPFPSWDSCDGDECSMVYLAQFLFSCAALASSSSSCFHLDAYNLRDSLILVLALGSPVALYFLLFYRRSSVFKISTFRSS